MVTTDNRADEPSGQEIADWLAASARELTDLIAGPGNKDERALQHWLERHPAFVPGAFGRGMSGHEPWPMALITQPQLSGLNSMFPDFCWLAADSAHLTAVLIEIETPAKPWQHEKDSGQSAKLTQAIGQIDSWRAWFAEPENAIGFLNEYRLPAHYRELSFVQHYILVHGSRAEYEGDRARSRRRAAATTAPDTSFMSFDRLPSIAPSRASRYGCVRIDEDGYHAVAVPPIWTSSVLDDDALRATSGYEQVLDSSGMPPERAAQSTAELHSRQSTLPSPFRFKPPAL